MAEKIEKIEWFEDLISVDEEEDSYGEIAEYDISASPNDFNIKTLFSFIEGGFFKIPGFQRNYVWDIKRASRLIESLILGIPIPQIFLYEEGKNKYLVVDGQQRLMTIYYFLKGRFPREQKRNELRKIFDENGKIPETIIQNDEYFVKFNLKLSQGLPGKTNPLSGLNYFTLEEHVSTLDFRTIRNIIVKQNYPDGDDSSIFELFNRLNTGGVNLKPQEIRTSLYHSNFYDMLYKINLNPTWRTLIGLESPDLYMKDIEVLIRVFGLLLKGTDYKPSMTRFLNSFSKQCKSLPTTEIEYLEGLFIYVMTACESLDVTAFQIAKGKFSFLLFEAFFCAICKDNVANKKHPVINANVVLDLISKIKSSEKFSNASKDATASKENVTNRLSAAYELYNA